MEREQVYQSVLVEGRDDGDGEDGDVDSDGEVIGLETLLAQVRP